MEAAPLQAAYERHWSSHRQLKAKEDIRCKETWLDEAYKVRLSEEQEAE